jgi:hypothetical protein
MSVPIVFLLQVSQYSIHFTKRRQHEKEKQSSRQAVNNELKI